MKTIDKIFYIAIGFVLGLLTTNAQNNQLEYPWHHPGHNISWCWHAVAWTDTLKSPLPIPFQDGDMIGCFYKVNGVQKCAGQMIYQTGLTTGIAVWGDNPFTIEKDGFYPTEKMMWKIYKLSTGQIYDLAFGYMDSTLGNWSGVYDMSYFRYNGTSAMNNQKAFKPSNLASKRGRPFGTYSILGVQVVPQNMIIEDRKLIFKTK